MPPRDTCRIRFRTFWIAVAALFPTLAHADWLTAPSTFTHDHHSGQRVTQYSPIAAPTSATQPIRTSGFTHVRSTLNYGKSADNYHRVTKWGDPVQPYAAFRFPFRPYGTPYPNWGAPFIGTGTNIQLGGGVPGGAGNGRFGGGGFGGVNLGPGLGNGGHNVGGPNVGGGGVRSGGRFPRSPRGRGFEQPIGPLTPYPSLPFDVNRTSPIYDGYYPTYRD